MKCQKPLTQQHSVTSQNTGIFNNIAVSTCHMAPSVLSISFHLVWVFQPTLHYALFCCHRLIRELFDYTREQQECSVIFIDEVDSICRQRTSKEQDLTRRWVISTYLKLQDMRDPQKWHKRGLVERQPEDGGDRDFQNVSTRLQNCTMSHTTKLIFNHIDPHTSCATAIRYTTHFHEFFPFVTNKNTVMSFNYKSVWTVKEHNKRCHIWVVIVALLRIHVFFEILCCVSEWSLKL